jgi:hypothetical protein
MIEEKKAWETFYQFPGKEVQVKGPYNSFAHAIQMEDTLLVQHGLGLQQIGVRMCTPDIQPVPPVNAGFREEKKS